MAAAVRALYPDGVDAVFDAALLGPAVLPAARYADRVSRTEAASVPEDSPAFDISVAHPARIYDYWLGGKDNFASDRAAGDKVMELRPEIVPGVRANRRFLGRAVRYLAAQAGHPDPGGHREEAVAGCTRQALSRQAGRLS